MTDRSERFFVWVWRINGLMLLGLALLAVAGVLMLVFDLGAFPSQPEDQLVEVAGADVDTENLRLADFQTIAGSSLLYAQLTPEFEYVGSGSGGGYGSAHNLLFFDTATKKAHWLLPANDQTSLRSGS